MPQEKIRILIDRSRDLGWSVDLSNMEPDTLYQATDNRDYLSWSVLKNYDVLAICSCSPLKYQNAEINLIRKFVESGGGLFLATSTSRFERDVGKPASEMGINELARLFGAEFLSPERCKGETRLDDNLLRGYTKENLRLINHPVVVEMELDDLAISNCGVIQIPAGAEVFLEHSGTRDPIGACVRFEKGRVLLINDYLTILCPYFVHDSQRICKAFIDWLAYNRISTPESDETIPDEIPVDEYIREAGKIKLYYTDFVKDRVDTCLDFAQKIANNLISLFPNASDISYEMKLNPSCMHEYNDEYSIFHIGALLSNPRLAYALGSEMTKRVGNAGLEILRDFSNDALQKCFGMIAMQLLGFTREAEEMQTKIIKQFKEKDPTGKECDISKLYPDPVTPEYHPKLFWVLNSLMEKYGQDLFVRLSKSIQEEDPHKHVPDYVFTAMDVLAYHLSRALEVDLYSWLEEIGTTIHRLPLSLQDSDEFKMGVHHYLKNIVCDKDANASDRNDAVLGLIDIYDDEQKSWSDVACSKSCSMDKYERLVAAIGLSRFADNRAVNILTDLASDEDDRTLAAIASLALVQRGVDSALERLFEIAKEQDYRFQLDAGYALHKVGYEKAEELSCKKLRNENNEPVVEMKAKSDNGYLTLFPMVAGHKIAAVVSQFRTHHFPEETHVTAASIAWVHTAMDAAVT